MAAQLAIDVVSKSIFYFSIWHVKFFYPKNNDMNQIYITLKNYGPNWHNWKIMDKIDI